MFYYDYFYRKYGIRRPDQLKNPPLSPMAEFEFPKDTIYHYTNARPDEVGPAVGDFLFSKITKPIFVDHVYTLSEFAGHPRMMPVQALALVKQYHGRNNRFKFLRDYSTVKDSLMPIVVSYALLNRVYKYVRSFFSDYYKWSNIAGTVWSKVAEVAGTSLRHQFVFCEVPTILPTKSELKLASEEYDPTLSLEEFEAAETNIALEAMTQRTLKIFDTAEKRMFLEFWKWTGPDRQKSIISKIAIKDLDRVNVVFVDNGNFTVMNLGVINRWRRTTEEEEKAGAPEIKGGLMPVDIQKQLLMLMLSIAARRNVEGNSEELLAQFDELDEMDEQSDAESGKTLVSIAGVKPGVSSAKTTNTDPQAGTQSTAKLIDTKKPAPTEEELEEDLKNLDRIAEQINENNTKLVEAIDLRTDGENEPLETGVLNACAEAAEAGRISAGEYRRFEKLSQTYKTLKAPNGQTLDKFISVPVEDLVLSEQPLTTNIKTIEDESELRSSIVDFDPQYVKKALQRDVANVVLNIQKAGIAVTNYEVRENNTVLGKFYDYSIQLVPVDGKVSTIKFQLPAVDNEGNYKAGGVNYRLRKQRTDFPIRKVGPDRVALTTYYGKTFVERSEKKVNDYYRWLAAKIVEASAEQKTITDFDPGNAFNPSLKCSRVFTSLSQEFLRFTAKGFVFDFTRQEIPDVIKDIYEDDGIFLMAMEQGKSLSSQLRYIGVDKNDVLYMCVNGTTQPMGSIEDFLEIDTIKAPVDFSELKVMGKHIPVGVILAYRLGLEKLIASLKATYRRVEAGKRLNLEKDEYAIVFDDETLIFNRDEKLATMILGGFNEYRDAVKLYSVYEFNRPNVYLNLIESRGMSVRYIREIDQMFQLFIDPISETFLREMKEPTTFKGLLVRASEMLLADEHANEIDPKYMRERGYERFAGAVYSELVKSVRQQRGRVDKSRAPIDLNPLAVWVNISQDPSKALVNEINPVQNLKEAEAITFGGTGGRDSRSMVQRTRLYHKNDIGIVSESTSDSSDVGVNIYSSASPVYTSIRGTRRDFDSKKDGYSSIFSTSAMLAPGSTRDDTKRVNFISIQNSHVVPCEGYHMPLVRTGYEQVVGHRTGNLFCSSARENGKVISVNDTGVLVEYESGEKVGIELGRRFGKSAGLTIPHNVISTLKPGQKIKRGDILAYNDGFFTPDPFNKGNVVMKFNTSVKTMLCESVSTLDDSSSISTEVAGRIQTKISYTRSIVIGFKDAIHKPVKVGDHVESDTVLCFIEDEVSARSGTFDPDSIDTLRLLSAHAPQAKHHGVVERIEVFYHGEKEDMSESVRSLANASDRELASRMKSIGEKPYTGSVDNTYRIEGNPLQLDSLVINVYITADTPMGVGDKGVFANQLKTVICDVFEPGKYVTESGVMIHAVFGNKSVFNRIVNSVYLIGTTATLLKKIGAKALGIYNNQ